MDARVKPGHDENGGGNASYERPWEEEGGRQPYLIRTTNLNRRLMEPAQQE